MYYVVYSSDSEERQVVEIMYDKSQMMRGCLLYTSISHQERILNTADEILVIADGKLVKRGSKEDVLPALLDAAQADTCLLYTSPLIMYFTAMGCLSMEICR